MKSVVTTLKLGIACLEWNSQGQHRAVLLRGWRFSPYPSSCLA
ncbi:hypothetical protein C4K26_3298 [Pseudomonas chlororaphis]|nr:hypothetical protein [Pseudomonas chlororaphis]AZD08701.1 hypothetical protein C4K26_3298 [Pseudomonas chlororaphis]